MMIMTTRADIQKIEYERRANVVKQMRIIIESSALKNGTDPILNIKSARDGFKQTLKDMDLPFSLLVINAMIEGALYIQEAQKMGTKTFPPEMSLGLLYLLEDEMIKERDEKLKDLNLN